MKTIKKFLQENPEAKVKGTLRVSAYDEVVAESKATKIIEQVDCPFEGQVALRVNGVDDPVLLREDLYSGQDTCNLQIRRASRDDKYLGYPIPKGTLKYSIRF